jgi:5-methylcytosine-specific restriction endonuclease McrA
MKKKRKQPTVKSLKTKADKIWFRKGKEKWGDYCIICGKTGMAVKIVGHHFYPKSVYGCLRHDLDNFINICWSCHTRFHFTGNPEIIEIIKRKRGEKWFKNLTERSKEKLVSIGVGYYKLKLEELENEI